jgi:hypothetical protein
MLDRRWLRRLPPDIELEVESLLSELRGEKTLPSEALDATGSRSGERDGYVPPLLRLRRFVGGSHTDELR